MAARGGAKTGDGSGRRRGAATRRPRTVQFSAAGLAGAVGLAIGAIPSANAAESGSRDCSIAEAISELTPDGRDALERACEGDPAPEDAVCGTEDDPCPGLAGAPVDRPPLCFGDGCDDPRSCDPRLCDLDVPPALDCAQFGIETVQFGYFDRNGGLHLDPARHSCTEAAEGRVVAGVDGFVIYPIALFAGTLTAPVLGMLDAPESAAGRPYCWLSHPSSPPEVGWLVRSGHNLIAVPSPGSAALAAEIAGDPTLFPRGCACLLDNIGCEDADENMNCDNGVDDDQDGLVDAEDPGCGA